MMRLFRWPANGVPGILLPLFLLPSVVLAEEIPFELHGGHFIVIKGTIDRMRDLNLVIDTGATSSVISRRLAEKMRLRGQPSSALAFGRKFGVQSVTLPVVILGSNRFEDVQALVCRLGFFKDLFPVRIDALIGMNLLKRTGLTIDYERKKISFGPMFHSSSSIPIYTGLPFVTVPLRAENRWVQLLLDTGAGDLFLYKNRVSGRVPMIKKGLDARIRHEGGTSDLEQIGLRDVGLGDSLWKELNGFLLDRPPHCQGFDGVLGVFSLGLKRINLDFQRSLMSWER